MITNKTNRTKIKAVVEATLVPPNIFYSLLSIGSTTFYGGSLKGVRTSCLSNQKTALT
jgi:hypothetical protein